MTTRRDLLTGTVAVIAAPLMPVPATALSPEPDATDALFIAAETKITAAYDEREAIEDHDTPEAEALWDRIWELDEFIAETPANSIMQATVKLRRVLDAEMGLPTGMRNIDVPSLALILDCLETIAGKPTHPTRPIGRDGE